MSAPTLRLSDFGALARAALGTQPEQRRAVKRVLLAARGYAIVCALMVVAAAVGFGPAAPTAWVVGYTAVGLLGFYAAVRSGRTARWRDPQLTLAQVGFGISVAALGYALLPYARGAMVPLLFVVLAFDAQRLAPRQLHAAAVLGVGALMAVLAGLWWWAPQHIDWQQELLNLGLTAVFVPVLLIVAAAVHRIQRRQGTQRERLRRALLQLKLLEQIDELTGAVNRRHMMALMHDELSRQRRTGYPVSLAMIDLDFLSHINREHGHSTGDFVLRELAALARRALHRTDVVARWGGEEFLLMLPDTAAAQAMQAMQRLRQHVYTHDWSAAAAPGLRVSFSCGVCEHAAGDNLLHTIARADAALRRAKEQGRNRVEDGCPT